MGIVKTYLQKRAVLRYYASLFFFEVKWYYPNKYIKRCIAERMKKGIVDTLFDEAVKRGILEKPSNVEIDKTYSI